jgi:hypothetical protein
VTERRYLLGRVVQEKFHRNVPPPSSWSKRTSKKNRLQEQRPRLCFPPRSLLGLLFESEAGAITILRNISEFALGQPALYPERHHSSIYGADRS